MSTTLDYAISGRSDTGDQRELPRYQSHKEVWALKIKALRIVTNHDTDKGIAVDAPVEIRGAVIVPEEDGYAPLGVDVEYVAKHNPQVGGYFVQYKDGYQSFAPAEAFESGYTPVRK